MEHLFIGAALRSLWSRGIVDVEILRSEFDAYGYDVVLSRDTIVRHIQLKSGLELKKISVSRTLAARPSGCAVFLKISDDLELLDFYFFGSTDPWSPLPSLDAHKVTKRTTPNAFGIKPERRNHRDVSGNMFRKLDSLDHLVAVLIGSEIEPAS